MNRYKVKTKVMDKASYLLNIWLRAKGVTEMRQAMNELGFFLEYKLKYSRISVETELMLRELHIRQGMEVVRIIEAMG